MYTNIRNTKSPKQQIIPTSDIPIQKFLKVSFHSVPNMAHSVGYSLKNRYRKQNNMGYFLTSRQSAEPMVSLSWPQNQKVHQNCNQEHEKYSNEPYHSYHQEYWQQYEQFQQNYQYLDCPVLISDFSQFCKRELFFHVFFNFGGSQAVPNLAKDRQFIPVRQFALPRMLVVPLSTTDVAELVFAQAGNVNASFVLLHYSQAITTLPIFELFFQVASVYCLAHSFVGLEQAGRTKMLKTVSTFQLGLFGGERQGAFNAILVGTNLHIWVKGQTQKVMDFHVFLLKMVGQLSKSVTIFRNYFGAFQIWAFDLLVSAHFLICVQFQTSTTE